MIRRELIESLLDAATHFPVIALSGPKDSGKTTLAQYVFGSHHYISLDDPALCERANLDPKGFLHDYGAHAGLIFNEIDQAPALFSHIRMIIEKERKMGYFIFLSSQNLESHNIVEIFDNKISFLTLLPLSIAEIANDNKLPKELDEFLLKGCFPKLYKDKSSKIENFYSNHMSNYLNYFPMLQKVSDLHKLKKFMKLCAETVGQLLDIDFLAHACDIEKQLAQDWLGALQASYIIFLLQPYPRDYDKRELKKPKLYFIDTGILCSLLSIASQDALKKHDAYRSIVKSCIISDFFKQNYNRNRRPYLYFWQDMSGHAVDCVVDETLHMTAIDIREEKIAQSTFFDQLIYLKTLMQDDNDAYVIYAGHENLRWPQGDIITWQHAGTLIKLLYK